MIGFNSSMSCLAISAAFFMLPGVCGQVKVLSLALRKTIFVAAKIAAVRCSLAHCSFRFDAAADPVIRQK